MNKCFETGLVKRLDKDFVASSVELDDSAWSCVSNSIDRNENDNPIPELKFNDIALVMYGLTAMLVFGCTLVLLERTISVFKREDETINWIYVKSHTYSLQKL